MHRTTISNLDKTFDILYVWEYNRTQYYILHDDVTFKEFAVQCGSHIELKTTVFLLSSSEKYDWDKESTMYQQTD